MRLGIDFGTCYSSAALLIDGVLHPVKEPLRPLEYCFPSSVCVTKKGEIIISQAAENQRRLNPQGYINHFKRDLDTDIPYFLGEQQLRYMPEDLVTIMLAGLKKEAEKIINSPLDSAVITVPATYLMNKKQLMEQAAKEAGFSEVSLLEEPVAAAIYYSQKGTLGHQVNDGDILLVYDLGGGTFDAALIQKKGNSYQLLSQPVGDRECGGIYFDSLIGKDFIQQLNGSPVSELFNSHRQDKEALRAKLNLQDWCRNFKHQLSLLDEYEDLFPLSSDSYTLSRDEFEVMISPFIDSSCNLCQQLLQQSGIKWESINRVLLVGGSCRIPCVQKRLEQQFKCPVVQIDDPELAICFGATIYGFELRETQREELEQYESDEQKNTKFARIQQSTIATEDFRTNIKPKEDYSLAQKQLMAEIARAINEVPTSLARSLKHYATREDKATEITAKLVKELRDKTGAGIMDCKRALQKSNADIAKAVKLLQEKPNCQKIIRLAPDDTEPRCYLEMPLSCPDKIENAKAELQKTIRLNPNAPNNASAHNNLGLILESQGKPEEAIAKYKKAIRLDPNLAIAHTLLGCVLFKEGKREEAQAYFEEAIRLNPNDPNLLSAHILLGRILDDRGKLAEAIAEYKKAISLNPNDPENAIAHNNLGLIFYNQGMLQAAKARYQQAIRLNPNNDIFYKNLEMVQKGLEVPQKGLEVPQKGWWGKIFG